jgi:hypothetical protein
MKGIPISFIIDFFLMRGKIRGILIRLKFDHPGILIRHYAHDEAEGLVKL